MADCDKIRELIDLYIDGEIAPSDEKTLFEHLEECPECKVELENAESVRNLLKNIPEMELPDDFHNEIMNKIGENKKARVINFRWVNTAVAAVVVVLCVFKLGDFVQRKTADNIALTSDAGQESATDESMYTPDMAEYSAGDLGVGGVNSRALSEADMAETAAGVANAVDFEYVIETDDVENCTKNIKNCLDEYNIGYADLTVDGNLTIEAQVIGTEAYEICDKLHQFGEMTFENELSEEEALAYSRMLSMKITIVDKNKK